MDDLGKHAIDPLVAFKSYVYENYANTHESLSAETDDEVPPGKISQLRKYLRRFLPADHNACILDIGCGSGALLAVAEELEYKNLLGTDQSPTFVARARMRSHARVDAKDIHLYLTETADASIDAICAFDVLEHFSRPELLRLCRNIARVLKPGGTLILHVPNGASPMAGRTLYGDLTHELAFTAGAFNQILLPLGFEKTLAYEDEPVPSSFRGAIRFAMWRFIRIFILLRVVTETGLLKGHVLTGNMFAVARKRRDQH